MEEREIYGNEGKYVTGMYIDRLLSLNKDTIIKFFFSSIIVNKYSKWRQYLVEFDSYDTDVFVKNRLFTLRDEITINFGFFYILQTSFNIQM